MATVWTARPFGPNPGSDGETKSSTGAPVESTQQTLPPTAGRPPPVPAAPPAATDVVLVVDFGAQYAQLIARRVREARVYSEIVPSTMPVAEMLAKEPAAIIFSGGPSSVYEPGAPTLDASVYNSGVPLFGICYGFQLMAQG